MDDRSRQDTGDFLKRGAWFGGLPGPLQDVILRRSLLRTYRRGAVVQYEDAPAVGLIAVLEGRLHLVRHVGASDAALLHVAGPGYWTGEVAIIDGRTLVTCVARTFVKALVFSKHAFDRLVADEPRYYPSFARLVTDRFRLLAGFHAEALGLSADARLRLRLAELVEMRRLDVGREGPVVVLEMTQGELAQLVGLSRQKLNARLQELQQEGLLTLERQRIRVLDPDGLRATALGSRDERWHARGRASGRAVSPVLRPPVA
jgi:CRP-like cAMP-binding protein